MWKILKAQFNYNKLVLIGCAFFSLAVIIPFIIQDWRDIDKSYPALRATLFAMTTLFFFSSFVRNMKEKRDRFFNKLPLKLWQLGLTRLLLVIIFWTCLMIIVAIAFIIRPIIFSNEILMDLLSQTGFIFYLISLVYIVKDISYFAISKKNKILINIFNYISILGSYLLFMLFVVSKNAMDISPSLIPIKEGFNQFIISIPGSALFIMLGVTMTSLSTYFFSKRKTFK